MLTPVATTQSIKRGLNELQSNGRIGGIVVAEDS